MDNQIVKKIVLSMVLAALCGTGHAAPIATVKESYYSINGSTAQELRAQMRKLGPTENSTPYDAYTKYYVKWRYHLSASQNGCQLTDIRVSVDTSHIYPRWDDYDNGSARLQANWSRYFAKLTAHERQHARHGSNAASEIDAMLSQLPAMANCDVLDRTANDQAYAILGRYQRADGEYDQRTNHGIDEGVILNDE